MTTEAQKVTLFGNFGTQNLGNECTLQAIIHNLRKYLPHAAVNCICTDPKETSERHNIAASPMSARYRCRKESGSTVRPGHNHPLVTLLRRMLIRIPNELLHWVRAFKTLRGTTMLVMAGTGMLGDFGIGPFELHYEIFKWSLLAKLRGSKLLFVSVGVGELKHPLNRWFVKSALSLADYRSYRDSSSKEFLARIGFNACDDFVYPDLAFSLPHAEIAGRQNGHATGPVIGLGLMGYYGQACNRARGGAIYHAYLENVAAFVTWLLDHGYTVRLLVGDVSYDSGVPQDVIQLLRERGVRYDETRLIHEPVSSVEQLLSQLATTKLVVASRFHNVLLALMLTKPVVSISYYERKNESLMAEMGLAEYCQHIERLDIDHLIDHFVRLEEQTKVVKPHLEQKTGEYQDALDQQYRLIFNQALA